MKRQKTSRLAISVPLLMAVFALLLTACSSATKNNSSTGVGKASSKESVIKIGNIGQYSGVNDSPFLGGNTAVQAWVDWTNSHGGIDGHKIQLFAYNTGGSASTALTDMKLLINTDHVDAIVGEQDPDAVTWASLAENAGIPVVGGNATDALFFTNPDFFPDAQTANDAYTGIMKKEVTGAPKSALIYCTESPTCSTLIKYLGNSSKADGGSLVAALPVAVTSPTFTSQCLAAKSKGANVMVVGAPPSTLLSVAQDCANQNYFPTFVTTATTVTEPVAEAIAKIPHMQSVVSAGDVPFFVKSTPAMKEFYTAMNEYEPSTLATSTLTEQVVTSWAAANLLGAAIKASGSFTPSGIKTGLYDLHNVTLGGLTPPLTFAKGKPTSVKCGFIYAATATSMTLPNGLSLSC